MCTTQSRVLVRHQRVTEGVVRGSKQGKKCPRRILREGNFPQVHTSNSGVHWYTQVHTNHSRTTLVCTGTHWYTLVHNPVTLVLGFSVMCAVLKGLLSDTELKGTFISCAIPLRSTYSGTCVCSTSAVPHEQMHHCKSDVWEECRRGAVQADGGAPTDASWSP